MLFGYSIQKQNNDYSFLSINGEINVTSADHFKAALEFIVKNGKFDIRIDCSELTYMDSSGLQALLVARQNLAGSGREVRLINVKSYIIKIFRITNMDRYFSFDKNTEALA